MEALPWLDKIICGDCLDVMRQMPEKSIDLIFADPPYNTGKAEWDKIENYMEWCELWIAEAARILKLNGAFWVSHSEPDVLADISRAIAKHGRKRINWITWDKYNGNPTKQACGGPMVGVTQQGGLRSFQVLAEYLIYHANNPMPNYLKECREKAGLTRNDVDLACGNVRRKGLYIGRGTDLCYRWEAGDCLPTEEQYIRLVEILGCEKTYFDDLCYVFNNPGRVSSVWQIPPAPRNGHPTPKPEALLDRIIKTTSNPGDIVLDPFLGSGTTAVAAKNLGRFFIGIEKSEEYCAIANRRIEEALRQPRLFCAN